ncbi:MAG: Flp family type IVb pilin [Candidatus Sericytochromatia bacterium]|jgi:pilus assembly protein Flp/PilA|nr:Flp family type IVb pilin [Candidatus Tanganyikabacteria bacterium]MEB3204566.1 Flp family type IVb pilin [Candidatus Sericytochromatia bacterium]
MSLINRLVREEEGQSMVEYGIIVAVIAAVCIGGYKAVGAQVNKSIDTLIKNMK